MLVNGTNTYDILRSFKKLCAICAFIFIKHPSFLSKWKRQSPNPQLRACEYYWDWAEVVVNTHILNYLKCFCQRLAVSKEYQFTLISLSQGPAKIQILHFRIFLLQLLGNLERWKIIVSVYSDICLATYYVTIEKILEMDGVVSQGRIWPATQIAHS